VRKRALFILVRLANVQNRQVLKVRRDLVGGYLTDLSLRGVQ